MWRSPDQHLTWVGFATFVTVMCGASLTLVTNVADICRYTPTRRDMRIGLVASSLLAAAVTTFVGGYAAAATGKTNPFVAVVDLTRSKPLLVVLALAIVVQGIAANITNDVHVRPLARELDARARPLPRDRCSSRPPRSPSPRFPSFVDHAQRWITHLGNVAAPLTGVVLADYLLVQRARIDVPALFDPAGRYRYLNGVNVAALLAVAVGSASTTRSRRPG